MSIERQIEHMMGLKAGTLQAPTARVSAHDQMSTTWAQLLPAVDFAPRDGRLGPGKRYKIDNHRGALLAAKLAGIAEKTPVVIDFDHQTLRAAATGEKAPAAGWIYGAQWVPGQGLFASVNWTRGALDLIAAREYRYISPVVGIDAELNVTEVQMASLCNLPAVLGMRPVVASVPSVHSSPARFV